MISRDEITGTLSLLGGVGLFSTVEIASKIIGPRVDPIVLTFIRFFVTGLLLILISLPILRYKAEPFSRRDYGIFFLNGLIGITLALSLFHTAILVLDKAASAAVIFCINPVFVVVLARYINLEPWSGRKWIGVCLGVAGVFCFAYESGIFSWHSLSGLSLMVLSAFLFALSTCISRRVVARYGALVLMGFSSLSGSLILLPLALIRMEMDGLAGIIGAALPILYITLFGTSLAYFLYYFGLLNTSAQRGAMIFFLKPVLATVLAVLILGEEINAYMLAGIVLILSGLFLELPRNVTAKATQR
ncbi:MAG TPA: DMT family transporter [Syntrophales bacterium]|nr:DMT family transporter [Syntrophales bacterium]HPX57212.1 DMT family transporter [Syntrophales bacterium]HQA83674.1 DMT family transporter [Syntrophales bacterium]